jgi:hypothetical protein
MRVLLTLGLIGAIVCPRKGTTEPSEPDVIPSAIEVHSVVVDQPPVSALPRGLGDIWDLLKSSGQLVETVSTSWAEPCALNLLQVSLTANIRSGPFASAEIVGIAPAGSTVQAVKVTTPNGC